MKKQESLAYFYWYSALGCAVFIGCPKCRCHGFIERTKHPITITLSSSVILGNLTTVMDNTTLDTMHHQNWPCQRCCPSRASSESIPLVLWSWFKKLHLLPVVVVVIVHLIFYEFQRWREPWYMISLGEEWWTAPKIKADGKRRHISKPCPSSH